jgi:hypothetical protein
MRIGGFADFHKSALVLVCFDGCADMRIRASARMRGTGSADTRIRSKAHVHLGSWVRFCTGVGTRETGTPVERSLLE